MPAAVFASRALAAPAPVPAPFPQPSGITTDPITGLVSGIVSGVLDAGSLVSAIPATINDLEDALTSADAVEQAIANGTIFGTNVPVLVQKLFSAIQPTGTPTNIEQARSSVAAACGINDPSTSPTPPASILEDAVELVLDGFTSSDIQAVASGADPFENAANNQNPAVPSSSEFYNKVKGNAPFSVSEDDLRAAIYIPPDFTWGKKQPIVMSPGTGAYGYINFRSNIGKLLAQTDYADPVYLNIPNALLGDAQISAEYVAYALQYFNATTRRKPAIVTWSQGSLNAQWAFKYWPSIPSIVTDHIAISPDYHGTILAYILCPGFETGNDIACTPAVLQQDYQSNFVNRLRSNGGDSAYVPTTTVYSATDEIAQPQTGTAATGYLNDARNVGVSDTFLQGRSRGKGACAGLPAGLIYTHEGVLYNPVAYALVTDALTHSGPGSFLRVEDQCSNVVAPGISLSDVMETESLIPLAALNIFSYMPKITTEPAIKSYATF
ncbi:lipase B precursor protein [Rutstroemia sp. NJR-2017a BVV2]|nr:lipase B precursor protein [Rutstroemia sp. NJR-2017a BVV2]